MTLINAAWETRDEDKHICRWAIAWEESSDHSISGAIGGYSGGGSFEMEMFHATIGENGELTSLWIDFTDHVSGEEIDFQSLGSDVLQRCENAEDLIFEFNDMDEWEEGDELVLRPEADSELNRDGDMLYYSTGSLAQARIICEKLGLTAGPDAA